MADRDEDQGITAYHGSPHEFDQFDLSKIGTGEGAQAYGHGLYFAEAEPTARQYRDALSTKLLGNIGGQGATDWDDPSHVAASWLKIYKTPEAAIDYLETLPEKNKTPVTKEAARLLKEGSSLPETPAGHMYEVSINAHPDHFLDWDKSFADQSPYVKNLLKTSGLMKEYTDNLSDFSTPMQTRNRMKRGENIHAFVEHKMGKDPEKASQYFADLGIKGIKYLDAGSRDKKRGTRNYVVFDDKLVNVKRRYARGGEVDQSELQKAAHAGRNGDTLLAHINPQEAALLKDLGGSGTINPETGLPEFSGADPSGSSVTSSNFGGGDSGGRGGIGSDAVAGGTAGGRGDGGGNGGGGSDRGDGGVGIGGLMGSGGGGGRDTSIGGGGGAPSGIGGISGGFGSPGAMGSFGTPDQGQAADESAALSPGKNIGSQYLGAALGSGKDLSIGGPQGLTGAAAFGNPDLGTNTFNLGTPAPTTIGGSLGAAQVSKAIALGQQMATPEQETRESWLAKNYPESPRLGDLAQPTPAAPFATQDRAGSMASMPMGTSKYGSDMTLMSSQPSFPHTQTPFSGYPADVQKTMIPNLPDSAFGKTLADPTGAQTQEALKNMEMAQTGVTMLNAPGLMGSLVRAFTPTPTPATPQQQASIERMYRGTLEGGVPANFATPEGMLSRYGYPTGTTPDRAGSMGSMPSGTTQYGSDLSQSYTDSGQRAGSVGSMPQSSVGAGTPLDAYDRGTSTSPRSDFNQAFAAARAEGKDVFSWTNPVTGQTSLYTTQLARKEGGRVPSLNDPDAWLEKTRKPEKAAAKTSVRKPSKIDRTSIVKRALMLSSHKS